MTKAKKPKQHSKLALKFSLITLGAFVASVLASLLVFWTFGRAFVGEASMFEAQIVSVVAYLIPLILLAVPVLGIITIVRIVLGAKTEKGFNKDLNAATAILVLVLLLSTIVSFLINNALF